VGDVEDRADTLLADETRVGDFEICGFLGEGAMGQVYLAEDVKLGRRVALKFIKRSMMQDGGVERFLEEARATASFNHPHIVTLHAVGEHDGRPYLALEYIDGESLRARLASGPLPIREALRCCRAVAEAIAEAHRCGLVHADLKPENIVISRHGRVRVVDFGLARLAGGAPNAASGTPAYMAPERWRGAPPTGAIDVWALGVTLHELIAGRRPIAEVVLQHLAYAPGALELTDLPEARWAQLVRDCLALDPEARPTAEELVRRLTGLLDPHAVTTDDARLLRELATRAQRLMSELTADEVRIVRGVLLALIDPDGACRPRPRGELLDRVPGSREAIGEQLDRLVERGLVVAARDGGGDDVLLEVAHEALPGAWPQLAAWLDEAQARRRRRRAFSTRDVALPSDARTLPAVERMAPLDYDIERQRHEAFIGRDALLAQLDQLLVHDPADRRVVVTGGPGMGKSALLAAWLLRREAAGVTVPHHFIRRGEYDWDDPVKLVGSLVAQIEARYPALREPDADARKHPAARLAAVLARVSANELAPYGERMVVLIDGLDEYDPPQPDLDRPAASDPLAAFLPHALPRGVSLLCASRPRHPYVSSLEARDGELVRIDLDDPTRAADNDATVRAFWERAAPALGLDARFIDEAVRCAGGNVQHAVTLQRQLAVVPREQRRVEAIPRGLAALLEKSWERIATEPIVVDNLGVLCAAREALTLEELGAVAGWAGDAQRRAFVRGARELLVETRRPDGQAAYSLHHDSIRTHIARVLGAAALRAHHVALARRLATWPPAADATARTYALAHALTHRAEAGDWADAWRLAGDMGFLEAKCRELGAHEAEAEAARVAERCRATGDAALCRRFGDLARALARESHWLRTAPEATAALVWNRLRLAGWSADEIDAGLQVQGGRFLRVRYGTARASPALVRTLVGHSGSVNACTVTADGRRVVSGSEDGTLKVWDLESGRVIATLEGHAGEVRACAVTADGRRVVSGSEDGTLKVWDLESGRVVATLRGHAGSVNACAVTADGRAVSASEDATLKVWDLDRGQVLAVLEGHAGWVRACAVTADGRRVLSASVDGTLKVWDPGSGRALSTLEGHTDWVRACAVTADGRRAISASADQTLRVWDLERGELLATLEGHANLVEACAVTADGRRAISASYDRTLKVWDLESGQVLATLEGHTAAVGACAVTPDGRRVISASADRALKVWDLEGGRAFATLEGHAGAVSACAVAPDGRRVISASADRALKVWDLERGHVLATLDGHASAATACAVTPDGRRMVSASYDRTLKVWDLERGRVLATLEGHTALVSACAVTPDGRRMISASADRTLRVWDLERGRMLATLDGHARSVSACAVTPDGRRVVSASYDGTLRIWDLERARALLTLEGHTSVVSACAVTSDGRRVLSASWDKTLRVWDLESGRALATLEGHAGWVSACAVVPDGHRAISASDDRTLKVWDLDRRACLFTHRGDTAYTAVAATATALVAGDDAGAVWVLEWPR
jgi:WD40 repeat protein/tRNA A-37 threonylcarbamoyl transferase component Bud32